MNDDNTKPILLVKKSDSKKGSLWSTFTNKRIIKQHGGFDIPEGDLHAVPKYHDPLERKTSSPEETKEVLSDIEKEIEQLKNKEKQTPPPPSPTQNTEEQYSDGSQIAHQDKDENLY